MMADVKEEDTLKSSVVTSLETDEYAMLSKDSQINCSLQKENRPPISVKSFESHFILPQGRVQIWPESGSEKATKE
jgi:hypothetical protein